MPVPAVLRGRAVLALAAAAALLVPALARAQRAAIRGQVVTADSSHRPVGGAEVAVQALGRGTRAAEDGTFLLDGLPAGAHEVTVRRVGFEPVTRRVTLRDDADTATVSFALTARVVALATVDVREKAAAPATPAARAFERERALANGGVFVDDSLLTRNEHAPMSNVLRRIPGASIVRLQTLRGSINVLGSSRGGQSVRGGPKHCYYQVFLDGVRRYSPGGLDVPPDVDEFKVADYEAIEVYRGGAQTPTQYGGTGAACGTVLFWSRTRR